MLKFFKKKENLLKKYSQYDWLTTEQLREVTNYLYSLDASLNLFWFDYKNMDERELLLFKLIYNKEKGNGEWAINQ